MTLDTEFISSLVKLPNMTRSLVDYSKEKKISNIQCLSCTLYDKQDLYVKSSTHVLNHLCTQRQTSEVSVRGMG